MVDFFGYKKGQLHCEDVPVAKLAARHGTPLYVYSARTMTEHFERMQDAFPSALICYSVKANSNLGICSLLAGLGSGFDVVSGGELYRALRAGGSPEKIVFAGVGKTRDEISFALRSGILMLNSESEDEIRVINDEARRLRKVAPIAMRINPDIQADTHKYLRTGHHDSKFGFSIEHARRVMSDILKLRNVALIGLHVHIGSQITRTAPYVKALKKVAPLIDHCRALGHPLRYLDTGGGFGIFYKDEEARCAADFAKALTPPIEKLGLQMIMEPGRFIVGNAGVVITRVIRTKTLGGRNFVICDAGMNTLIRPALYSAFHRIGPVVKRPRAKTIRANIVGPICESGDFLGWDREIPEPRSGDLLAVFSAGAYGYSMCSNYNSRSKPAEVLVSGARQRLISRTETYEDLLRLESK